MRLHPGPLLLIDLVFVRRTQAGGLEIHPQQLALLRRSRTEPSLKLRAFSPVKWTSIASGIIPMLNHAVTLRDSAEMTHSLQMLGTNYKLSA
jgi:hypothetical protein